MIRSRSLVRILPFDCQWIIFFVTFFSFFYTCIPRSPFYLRYILKSPVVLTDRKNVEMIMIKRSIQLWMEGFTSISCSKESRWKRCPHCQRKLTVGGNVLDKFCDFSYLLVSRSWSHLRRNHQLLRALEKGNKKKTPQKLSFLTFTQLRGGQPSLLNTSEPGLL